MKTFQISFVLSSLVLAACNQSTSSSSLVSAACARTVSVSQHQSGPLGQETIIGSDKCLSPRTTNTDAAYATYANADGAVCYAIPENSDNAFMYGTIDSCIGETVTKLLEHTPKIKQITMINVPGSMDDESNLKAAKRIYDAGLNTVLLANSNIASGGVDFFVAGKLRSAPETAGADSMPPSYKIGVHSWSDGENDATAFTPLTAANPAHKHYIDFYKSVGFEAQNAEDFYFFTINAATAEGIHNMTKAEIIKYKILNPSPTTL